MRGVAKRVYGPHICTPQRPNTPGRQRLAMPPMLWLVERNLNTKQAKEGVFCSVTFGPVITGAGSIRGDTNGTIDTILPPVPSHPTVANGCTGITGAEQKTPSIHTIGSDTMMDRQRVVTLTVELAAPTLTVKPNGKGFNIRKAYGDHKVRLQIGNISVAFDDRDGYVSNEHHECQGEAFAFSDYRDDPVRRFNTPVEGDGCAEKLFFALAAELGYSVRRNESKG